MIFKWDYIRDYKKNIHDNIVTLQCYNIVTLILLNYPKMAEKLLARHGL